MRFTLQESLSDRYDTKHPVVPVYRNTGKGRVEVARYQRPGVHAAVFRLLRWTDGLLGIETQADRQLREKRERREQLLAQMSLTAATGDTEPVSAPADATMPALYDVEPAFEQTAVDADEATPVVAATR